MKYVVTVILVALALAISVPMTAHSANITYTSSQIKIEGRLMDGDYKYLQRVIDRTGIKSLRLNSPGGSALEGYNLGYTINKNKMSTVIRRGDSCLSACAVAFLGGKYKFNYGIMGFHVAWTKQNNKDYNHGMKIGQMFGTIESIYHFKMGYTGQLGLLISQMTSKDDFLILSQKDLTLFEMKDNDFGKFIDLPKNFVADRIYSPLRLRLLQGGW